MGWESTTINGKIYNYYRQELGMECGPASCLTVGKLMGKGFSIDYARSGVRKNEMSMGGFNKNFSKDVSYMGSLVQILSGRGITGAWLNRPDNRQNYLEVLNKKVSPSHPAIMRVDSPYGHFVVCIGSDGSKGKYYLLDPELLGRHVVFSVNPANIDLKYQRPDGRWFYLDLNFIITT